ncbi:hypothetical protein GCM10010417_02150 [Streptomyces carpaticus]
MREPTGDRRTPSCKPMLVAPYRDQSFAGAAQRTFAGAHRLFPVRNKGVRLHQQREPLGVRAEFHVLRHRLILK